MSEHTSGSEWKQNRDDIVLNEYNSKDIYIRFGVVGEPKMTELYKITGFSRHELGDDHAEAEIEIQGEFGDDTDVLYYERYRFGNTKINFRPGLKLIKPGVFYQLVEKIPQDVETNEFLGKFFVKIKKKNL